MNILESENIFIYGVCGRSSSTALQRILNSSDEVFIFGEHHGLMENLVNSYFCAEKDNKEGRAKDLEKLIDCFEKKKHTSFYAIATNDFQPLAHSIKQLIIETITPPLDYSRTGFKEIGVVSQASLLNMEKMFPNSHFIFLFRNPIKQWGSVGFLKSFWDYAKNLDYFLAEYERIAEIYLTTPIKKSFFFENNSLRDINKVQQITKILNLANFDADLIDKTISSTNKRKISWLENLKIKTSKAYKLYFKMKNLELEIRH